MHSLGWTLLHFLWQGTAVAALAAVLMTLFRRSSARYALAVGALVLMLAAPLATFLFLMPSTTNPAEAALPDQAASIAASNVSPNSSSAFSLVSPSRDALPWLVEAWLMGVAFFSLRSGGGFLLLERQCRKQSHAVSDPLFAMCHTLQSRLGIERAIRYCECAWLQAPAVIGWFRPIILLPVTTLSGLSDEQLQLVIVHELAHIQRLDPFVNVFQIAVETLLFYHPAVWWLNKSIRAEREHCCDDIAVSVCGNPLEYARALTLMEEWRSAPALAMAANRGPLSERVFRVLGLKYGARGIGLAGGILCLTAALVAGNALVGIAYPKPTVHAAQMSPARLGWVASSSPHSQAAPAVAPASKPSPVRPQAAASQSAAGGSYIDGMKAAGLGDLTIDQLIAMKIQGVTPEYVRQMHDQGVRPNADTVISMRIQGVTPEYIHDLRGLGLNPNDDQIVAMKIQGVDANYVRDLKAAGVEPGVDQLIAMRIQGVAPEFVKGLHEQGLQPNNDQLVGMRIQGVTVDFVRDIHALGLKPTVDQFISMRIQGVTPEYVKAMQAAGYKFSIDDLISTRIQDVTPEFIELARKHGFQNPSLQKLIQLRQMGILEAPADL
jgi:beta-lactamase regulating signal transducer with metallopeptidase domain